MNEYLMRAMSLMLSIMMGVVMPIFPIYAVSSPDAADNSAFVANAEQDRCDFTSLPKGFGREASMAKARRLDICGGRIVNRLDNYLTTGVPVNATAQAKTALANLKAFIEEHNRALRGIAENSDYYRYTQALIDKGIKTAGNIRTLYKFTGNRNGGAQEYRKRKEFLAKKLLQEERLKEEQARRIADKLEARRKDFEKKMTEALFGTNIEVSRVEIAPAHYKYGKDANGQTVGTRMNLNDGEVPLIIKTKDDKTINALYMPEKGRTDLAYSTQLIGSIGHATNKPLYWQRGDMPLSGDMSLSMLIAQERNGKGEVVKEHQIVAGVKEGPLSKGVRYLLKPINWVFCKAETAAGGIVNSVGGLIGGDFGATSREAAKASWEQFIGKKPDGNVNRNLAPGQAHHLLSSSWGHVSNIGLRLGTGFVIGAGLGRLFPARASTGTNGVGRPAGEGINTSGVKGGFVDTTGQYTHLLSPAPVPAVGAPLELPPFNFLTSASAAMPSTTTSPLLMPITAATTGIGIAAKMADEEGGEHEYGYVGSSDIPHVNTPEGMMPATQAGQAGYNPTTLIEHTPPNVKQRGNPSVLQEVLDGNATHSLTDEKEQIQQAIIKMFGQYVTEHAKKMYAEMIEKSRLLPLLFGEHISYETVSHACRFEFDYFDMGQDAVVRGNTIRVNIYYIETILQENGISFRDFFANKETTAFILIQTVSTIFHEVVHVLQQLNAVTESYVRGEFCLDDELMAHIASELTLGELMPGEQEEGLPDVHAMSEKISIHYKGLPKKYKDGLKAMYPNLSQKKYDRYSQKYYAFFDAFLRRMANLANKIKKGQDVFEGSPLRGISNKIVKDYKDKLQEAIAVFIK